MNPLGSSTDPPKYPKISFNYVENDSGLSSVNINLVLFDKTKTQPKVQSITDFIFGEISQYYDQALFVISYKKSNPIEYKLIYDTYDSPELFGSKIEKFVSAVLHQLIRLKFYEASDKIYLINFSRIKSSDHSQHTYTLFHGLDSISRLI